MLLLLDKGVNLEFLCIFITVFSSNTVNNANKSYIKMLLFSDKG